jgi:hypothetical protein
VRELLGLKRELLRAVAKEQRPNVHDAFMPLTATDNFVVRNTAMLIVHRTNQTTTVASSFSIDLLIPGICTSPLLNSTTVATKHKNSR